MPKASAVVENVATPRLRFPVPMELPPSRNVTVPVGVPDPGATGETAAVKVTNSPNEDEFCEDVTVVAVSDLATTCGFPVSEPVLPVKFASPP